MSAALHLGKPADLDRLLPLVAAFHAETHIAQSDEGRRAGIAPLLEGSPLGAVYMVGPALAPVGYVVVTFGWSVEFGGMDGFIDEIYIRPGVRGRGIATEVLTGLCKALGEAGVMALHLEVNKDDEDTRRLYERMHFRPRDRYTLMSRTLS